MAIKLPNFNNPIETQGQTQHIIPHVHIDQFVPVAYAQRQATECYTCTPLLKIQLKGTVQPYSFTLSCAPSSAST